MANKDESMLLDELRELHAYVREFFRVQMSWVIFIGAANIVALLAFFSEGIRLEATTKPPLCAGFALLNLVTAAQFVVRRFDYQLLGKLIDEIRASFAAAPPERRDLFCQELILRTGGLFTLATSLLAVVWAVCCLHVWKHESLPILVYIVSGAVFLIVVAAIGTILGRQIAKRQRQLADRGGAKTESAS